ncbi:hypothetical protein [Lacrimispora sp.]|uniref:hypothetical protein n=1 Tax=Lacrimispora sp. TaxID=2719234 RepID=UPI0028A5D5BC|nr:hypothetical protein [Lacrimispora sp.]
MKAEQFRYDVGQIIGNVTITGRFRDSKRNAKRYYYCCNLCGNEDETVELTLKRVIDNNGVVCNTCTGMKVKAGINDIPTTASWMISYFQGGYEEAILYSRCSHKKVAFKCPDCGRIKSKPTMIKDLYFTHLIHCSCGDGYSYPNKYMYSALEQIGVEFISEYTPTWIKPKRYDFYIPSKSVIIEMDGGIGHGHTNKLSKLKPSEHIQKDKYKDLKATENGIKVIRIDCLVSDSGYISKNIIESKVFTEEELELVDFHLCDKFATSNKAKEVCEFYENNKPISTSKIYDKFKMSPSAVWKYLTMGNSFEWCDYEGKSIMRNNGLSRRKPVSIFKDDMLLRTYNSVQELCSKSEEDFGIRFTKSCVSAVARNETSKYKEFNFKYEKQKEIQNEY